MKVTQRDSDNNFNSFTAAKIVMLALSYTACKKHATPYLVHRMVYLGIFILRQRSHRKKMLVADEGKLNLLIFNKLMLKELISENYCLIFEKT